jgi:hypothetical protein
MSLPNPETGGQSSLHALLHTQLPRNHKVDREEGRKKERKL